MLITKEAQLNQQIKSSGISGIYLLCGGEDFLINNWKNQLMKSYIDESFNFVKLDGSLMDLSELYDCAQQLPMFAESRCVLFENIDSKKLNKESLETLETIFEDNPESTVLIITAVGVDIKSANAKKLTALADKYGIVAQFEARDTTSLTKYVKSILAKTGSDISTENAKELMRLCGNDMQKITVESEKLSAYTAGREVTSEDLALIIIPTMTERIFDLGKAILSRNPNRAMEITNNLIQLRESPIMVISTLVMSYVDLYRASIGKKHGKSAIELGKTIGYKGNQFRLQNAYNTQISLNAVQNSLNLLYKTDKQFKSTAIDNNLLLEKTVLQLIYLRES